MLLENVFWFLLGLMLLVKGSDIFVKSAASLAKKFGVSEFIIGLTLVALGTSIPELSSAIIASLKHESGFVIGNVVGANIANISLIIGIGASIAVIKTKPEMFRRDGYIMLFAGVSFFAAAFNNNITRIEAGFMLLLYFAYLMFLFTAKQKYRGKYHFREFIRYFFGFKYLVTIRDGVIRRLNHDTESKKVKEMFKEGMIKDLLVAAVSGVAIGYGANFFVTSAVYFAEFLDVSNTVIGASIVSLGTTMPELSVTVSAIRKGYGNIVVGNALGSVIANTLLIIGVAGLINPLNVLPLTVLFNAPFMIMMMIVLLFFVRSNWRISRNEGLILLLSYGLFMFMLFWLGIR